MNRLLLAFLLVTFAFTSSSMRAMKRTITIEEEAKNKSNKKTKANNSNSNQQLVLYYKDAKGVKIVIPQEIMMRIFMFLLGKNENSNFENVDSNTTNALVWTNKTMRAIIFDSELWKDAEFINRIFFLALENDNIALTRYIVDTKELFDELISKNIRNTFQEICLNNSWGLKFFIKNEKLLKMLDTETVSFCFTRACRSNDFNLAEAFLTTGELVQNIKSEAFQDMLNEIDDENIIELIKGLFEEKEDEEEF